MQFCCVAIASVNSKWCKFFIFDKIATFLALIQCNNCLSLLVECSRIVAAEGMVSERELFVSEKKSVDAFAASDCNFNSEAKSFTFAGCSSWILSFIVLYF